MQKLRELIRVITQTPTKTTSGGFTTINSTKFDTFAAVKPKSSRRVLESGTVAFVDYFECMIRYMDEYQIVLGDLIEYKGLLYDVTAVINKDERNRLVIFTMVRHGI